jgi:ribonuclease P protein component
MPGLTGRFSRADRVRRRRDFLAASRLGRRAASREYVVIVAPTPSDASGRPRLGVTVSRKVGNAVVRNRIKRRIREWFRRDREAVEAGRDVVVIARPAATGLSVGDTRALLSRLTSKADRP